MDEQEKAGAVAAKQAEDQLKENRGTASSGQNQTDEIGEALPTGDEVNAAINQQGDDAAAGIIRANGAAKYEQEAAGDQEDLQGAP